MVALDDNRLFSIVSTALKFHVFHDLYKDSVSLMQLGAALRARPGIDEASCIMQDLRGASSLASSCWPARSSDPRSAR